MYNLQIVETNNSLNKRNYIYIFIIDTFILLINYSVLLRMHFATDTYPALANANLNGAGYWQFDLTLGRYSSALLTFIIEKLNINPAQHQIIFMVLSIMILAMVIIMIFKFIIVNTQKKVSVLRFLFVYSTILIAFVNVYMLEWFLFPGAFILYNSIGTLLVTCSVYFLMSDKRKIIFSFLCLSAALGFYQVQIGIFLILALFSYLIINKINLKNFIVTLFIAGISSITNILIKELLIFLQIAESIPRDATLAWSTIISNIKAIWSQQKVILFSGSFMPPYIIGTFILIMLFFIIYSYIKSQKSINDYIGLILVLMVSYGSVFAPHVISGVVWMTPRTIVPFYFFIAALALYAGIITRNNRDVKILFITILLLIGVNYYQIQSIAVEHIAGNRIDHEFAYAIAKEIEHYEQINQQEIKYISIKNDIYPSYTNNTTRISGYDVNIRAFACDWSDTTLINYIGNRNFIRMDMPDIIYDKYFKDKNWDYYSPEEQMYFEGDTLYLMKY